MSSSFAAIELGKEYVQVCVKTENTPWTCATCDRMKFHYKLCKPTYEKQTEAVFKTFCVKLSFFSFGKIRNKNCCNCSDYAEYFGYTHLFFEENHPPERTP